MKFYGQIAIGAVTVAVVCMVALSAQAGVSLRQGNNIDPDFRICQAAAEAQTDTQLNARSGNGRGGHGPGNGSGNGGNGPKSGNGPKTGGCVNL